MGGEDGSVRARYRLQTKGTDWLFRFAMALDRGANLRMAGQLLSPRSGLRDQSTHERGLDQNRHDPPYGAKARLSILRQVLRCCSPRLQCLAFHSWPRPPVQSRGSMAKSKTGKLTKEDREVAQKLKATADSSKNQKRLMKRNADHQSVDIAPPPAIEPAIVTQDPDKWQNVAWRR